MKKNDFMKSLKTFIDEDKKEELILIDRISDCITEDLKNNPLKHISDKKLINSFWYMKDISSFFKEGLFVQLSFYVLYKRPLCELVINYPVNGFSDNEFQTFKETLKHEMQNSIIHDIHIFRENGEPFNPLYFKYETDEDKKHYFSRKIVCSSTSPTSFTLVDKNDFNISLVSLDRSLNLKYMSRKEISDFVEYKIRETKEPIDINSVFFSQVREELEDIHRKIVKSICASEDKLFLEIKNHFEKNIEDKIITSVENVNCLINKIEKLFGNKILDKFLCSIKEGRSLLFVDLCKTDFGYLPLSKKKNEDIFNFNNCENIIKKSNTVYDFVSFFKEEVLRTEFLKLSSKNTEDDAIYDNLFLQHPHLKNQNLSWIKSIEDIDQYIEKCLYEEILSSLKLKNNDYNINRLKRFIETQEEAIERNNYGSNR